MASITPLWPGMAFGEREASDVSGSSSRITPDLTPILDADEWKAIPCARTTGWARCRSSSRKATRSPSVLSGWSGCDFGEQFSFLVRTQDEVALGRSARTRTPPGAKRAVESGVTQDEDELGTHHAEYQGRQLGERTGDIESADTQMVDMWVAGGPAGFDPTDEGSQELETHEQGVRLDGD